MEAVIEKECSALGGLFQTTISDMKGSYPVWEDFINKAGKLQSQLRTTVVAAAAFLDAFQKVADMATNTRALPARRSVIHLWCYTLQPKCEHVLQEQNKTKKRCFARMRKGKNLPLSLIGPTGSDKTHSYFTEKTFLIASRQLFHSDEQLLTRLVFWDLKEVLPLCCWVQPRVIQESSVFQL
ncbi:Protein MTSS 1 [Varanus komodoensis]|nr:Protein MTSS 1 [Varanus komodoensis]